MNMNTSAVFLILLASFTLSAAKLRHTSAVGEKNAKQKILAANSCNVSTQVKCTRIDNGEPCDQAKTNQDCGPFEGLFNFVYCNLNPKGDEMNNNGFDYIAGELKVTDVKEKLFEPVDDHSLQPETCRALGHVKTVDSCANRFEASLEVEVWADDEVVCTSSAMYKILKPASISAE